MGCLKPGCCDTDALKAKCFIGNAATDELKRIRHKEDYELPDVSNGGIFPTYDATVVLNSFTERDDNVNRSFFASTWTKMKSSIIGQTFWVVGIYLVFYYIVQIIFVQGAVDACEWVSENSTTRLTALKQQDPKCNASALTAPPSDYCNDLGKKACATTFQTFVVELRENQNG